MCAAFLRLPRETSERFVNGSWHASGRPRNGLQKIPCEALVLLTPWSWGGSLSVSLEGGKSRYAWVGFLLHDESDKDGRGFLGSRDGGGDFDGFGVDFFVADDGFVKRHGVMAIALPASVPIA